MPVLTPVADKTSPPSHNMSSPVVHEDVPLTRKIALLDPNGSSRARTWKLLKELRLHATPFDRTSDLASAYVMGQQFGMLVLSFAGTTAEARVELDLLSRLAGPQTPIALLMQVNQIELSTRVMGSTRNDFVLLPVSNEELQQRLSRLYAMWGAKPPDWYRSESISPMVGRN